MSGMPPIPADVLAKMTPEQRARVEASMKARAGQAAKPETRKHCVTKEELNKDTIFAKREESCTRTVVTSTSSKLELRLQCDHEGVKTNGTFKLEAVNPENVKGPVQMTTAGGDHTMNISSNLPGSGSVRFAARRKNREALLRTNIRPALDSASIRIRPSATFEAGKSQRVAAASP